MKINRRVFGLVFLCVFWLLGVQVYASESDEIQTRVEKATSLGLQDWVDEEGYLIDRFYEGKSDAELSELGIDGLVRTLSEEEIDIYVSNLNQGISFYKVTNYQKASQINPDTGRTLYTGMFEVDGILAFCIERSATTPAKNSPTSTPVAVTNEKLRKVLYYGYNGPENQGYTFVETAMAAGEANGDGDNSLGRAVLAEVVPLEIPPSWFKVWRVETNGGITQDLAYYTIVEEGTGQIQKVSQYEEITKNNSNYSLQGAVFGVYSDSACTIEVGRISTDENGTSETITLTSGTYYVKEIIAPQGFKLNSEIKSLIIEASQNTLITMEDEPEYIVPDILLQKVDSETGLNVPQGENSLQGAEFLVKFYGGQYENEEDLQGIVPCKQWSFRTDEEGKIKFQSDYLIEGDSFWVNSANEIVLPLGMLTIQEMKASEGYHINQELFVISIKNNESALPTTVVPEECMKPEFKLPETGGIGNIGSVVSGFVTCYLSLIVKKRRIV